ncbi:Histone deacetylase 8 [Echinococcus granulosus]|uniref:histone deacetylase n=2 Tax=Echinococcus granulosus TaxID=6210 RepID=W6U8A2_ECHGR|nr:Histone deacetylase 8 [Echinococcus granulosus]EUB56601.1 Histone deacetylase 8 [Echinococcus granulosus]
MLAFWVALNRSCNSGVKCSPRMPSPVGIVYSSEIHRLSGLSPKYENRFSLVMGLTFAYGLAKKLLKIPPLEWCPSKEMELLTQFHSEDYIKALQLLDSFYTLDDEPNIPDDISEHLNGFGLSYDCNGFRGVYGYALSAVRGTLAAVDSLVDSQCKIAINWAGGWHHAKRSEASGFCYLNDIVLGAQRLLSSPKFSSGPLLYIDLDLHHGDGVEEAFAYTSRVVTFSVHHGTRGFFPGSGVPDVITGDYFRGARGGQFSCFNLPLAEGADDHLWWSAVEPVLVSLHQSTKPIAVFIQCGADALSTDPHRIFNLSASLTSNQSAYVSALKLVLSWGLPTLVLGGGGYHLADTARLWLILTAVAISCGTGEEIFLEQDIPDHSNLSSFGPDFTLDVRPSMLLNRNSSEAVSQAVDRLLRQIDDYCAFNRV